MSLIVLVAPFLLLFSLNAAVIVINTAGDAQNPGRSIDDSFERTLCKSIATTLKNRLEQRPQTQVYCYPQPYQTVMPFGLAQYVNNLQPALVITVHCFQTQEDRTQLYIYHYLHAATDTWHHRTPPLSFIPYYKAHIPALKTTLNIAHTLTKNFQHEQYQHYWYIQPPVGVPLTALAGITCPALSIEIGLLHAADWRIMSEPLAQCLVNLCDYL